MQERGMIEARDGDRLEFTTELAGRPFSGVALIVGPLALALHFFEAQDHVTYAVLLSPRE